MYFISEAPECHETHPHEPLKTRELTVVGQEQSPKKEISKQPSCEESVITREQNIPNVVTEFTVLGHSQILDDYSIHRFQKNWGRRQISLG